MKKLSVIFVSIIIFASNSLYAGLNYSVPLAKSLETGFVISSKTSTGFSAKTSIESIGLSEYQTPEGVFTALEVDGYSKNYGAEGRPHLPVITRLIEVPYGATVKINMTGYDTEIISLAERGSGLKIGPMQPSVSKNIPADKVKFYYNTASYNLDAFNAEPPVTFEDIGTMRGMKIGRLKIAPFRYNPARNIVKVLNNFSFEVAFENADTAKMAKVKKRHYSPAFKSPLSSVEKLAEVASARKGVINTDAGWPLTYVIVAHEDFRGNASLNDFIQWKTQTGFNVIEAYTGDSTVGITKESIKAYLKALYNSSVVPSYVLLIGDVDKIPSWDRRIVNSVTANHVTDLYYFTYDDESDYIPEVYYGRFPADNDDELDSIIAKTLQYVKYQFSSEGDFDYLNNYMFIAGDDSDYASIYGNSQINYAVEEYFPTIYKYLYMENRSDIADNIRDNFNSGMGLVNYTGHCTEYGWYNDSTSDFDFDSDDIAELINVNKYGFVIGNCCLSNNFEEDDCFGENIVKKTNGGAVGYIGASNDTFWDEDFYWAVGPPTLDLNEENSLSHTPSNTGGGVYDGLFHDDISAGQIIYCGNLAVASKTSVSMAQYYWEIYHLMGDPSLIPYLEEPATNKAGGTSLSPTDKDSETCFIGTVADIF